MLTLVSETSTEPVSLSEAKTHLRMDDIDADDTYITSLISAARAAAERETNRDILSRTWDYKMPAFPVDEFALPKAPVSSVTSIKYIDGGGVEQTVADSVYDAHLDATSPFIYLSYGKTWPSTREQADAVAVRFVTGYSSTPEPIVAAIKMLVADLYQNRASAVTGTIVTPTLRSAQKLLAPYRRLRL